MAKRMLIDATHPEETRVVVISGKRLEEFDFETASKKQLKGNIYLAKVTRVEPSLQAAFVEYGGNRHGFLAFNEIHPDYYRIPVADREALIAEVANEPEPETEPEQGEEPEAENHGESEAAPREERALLEIEPRDDNVVAQEVDSAEERAETQENTDESASGEPGERHAEAAEDSGSDSESGETAASSGSLVEVETTPAAAQVETL